MIPYGRQSISASDIQAVVDVLSSDWLTQGPSVERFERAVADYCGASYAVAVNSATAALHLACLAADLGAGDTLWTSPNTFVASANCALYCGASVDFVDIDERSYNMGCGNLEQKLEKAALAGHLPRVVVPVHFAGQPCDMAPIAALAKRFGFSVIEDASHAIGGRYLDTSIGSCAYSDMTVFSFHPVKIITTGEGGMVLTNNRDLYERLVRLRSHGIVREVAPESEEQGPWYYRQLELGYNYRMTDIQAALGLSQLSRLDQFVERRHALVRRYNQAFEELDLILPWQSIQAYSAFHLYVICLPLNGIRKTRRVIFEELRSKGIMVNVHYIPVHRHPYYEKLGFKAGDFPCAEQYYQQAITLPLYYSLSEQEQDMVINAVREALQ